jgi:hypothetical protein
LQFAANLHDLLAPHADIGPKASVGGDNLAVPDDQIDLHP